MNKKIIVTILILSIFCVSKVHAEFDKSVWKFTRTIDQANDSGIVNVVLPPNMTWAKEDQSDLRIVDQNDIETPYVYSKQVYSNILPKKANIINQVTENNGTTKLVVDLGTSGQVISKINFSISNPNFRRQISVYSGSQASKISDNSWSLITDKGYIYSVTDPVTGETNKKTELSFYPSSARYFLIVIGSGEEGSLKVNEANYSLEKESRQSSFSLKLPAYISQNSKQKMTELTIDRGESGLISNAIKLSINDKNYIRRVIVYSSDTNSSTTENWNYLGTSIVSNISTSIFTGGETKITFPVQNKRYFKLQIVNEDNPALDIDNHVEVYGSNSEIVFEYKEGNSYKIYYGNKHATVPSYDISKISEYIDKESLPLIGVGQESTNDDYVPEKEPVVPFTERNKATLNIFLGIIILVIAVLIGLYLKKYLKVNSNTTDSNNNFTGGQNLN
jgi:hypothetical protein